jgi:hypothetical protein
MTKELQEGDYFVNPDAELLKFLESLVGETVWIEKDENSKFIFNVVRPGELWKTTELN